MKTNLYVIETEKPEDTGCITAEWKSVSFGVADVGETVYMREATPAEACEWFAAKFDEHDQRWIGRMATINPDGYRKTAFDVIAIEIPDTECVLAKYMGPLPARTFSYASIDEMSFTGVGAKFQYVKNANEQAAQ